MNEKDFEGCFCEIADICQAMRKLASSDVLSSETVLACKAAANLLLQFRQIVFTERDVTTLREKLLQLLSQNGEG